MATTHDRTGNRFRDLACNLIVAVGALIPVMIGAATADVYPVTGRWTYQDASAAGPAETCRGPYMDFRGERRFDTSGGVSNFRNVDVARIGQSLFALNDEFLTVPNVRGNVHYTLHLVDKDHLVMHIARFGRTITLRRCA